MSDREIHLTDQQYLELLIRARNRLIDSMKIDGYDNTTPGCKSTDTNVGLCDDSLTTEEIAMWPDLFVTEGRKTMKYRVVHQKCPLDWRTQQQLTLNGCFCTCWFFKRKLRNLTRIRSLYDVVINSLTKEVIRKPIRDGTKRLLMKGTEYVWLGCLQCGCEFEVTKRSFEEIKSDRRCPDCLRKETT